MERSRSAPPEGSNGGAVVNPFWSEGVRREMAIRAARPDHLPTHVESPAVPTPEPIRDDVTIGKGRGVMSSGKMGAFSTPPSRAVWPDDVSGRLGMQGRQLETGRQTEGAMPSEVENVSKTMGPVPSQQQDFTELQRSLEIEVVSQLRDQNAKLLAELERLRKQSNGSTSSWSEVDGAGQPSGVSPSPATTSGVRQGYHTPRAQVDDGNSTKRFTPGGTQIPDGTPPTEAKDPSPPPPPPSLPPFPAEAMSVDHLVAGYEKKEERHSFKRSDRSWEPSKSREPTPNEARSFWLEREVASLKTKLDSITHGSFKESQYWSNGFQPVDLHASAPADATACAGYPPGRDQDRAGVAVHGGEFHPGRAEDAAAAHAAARDGVCHHDRAGAAAAGTLGTGTDHGGVCHQARAADLCPPGVPPMVAPHADLCPPGVQPPGALRSDLCPPGVQPTGALRADLCPQGVPPIGSQQFGSGALQADLQGPSCRDLHFGPGGGGKRREEERSYGAVPTSWEPVGSGNDVPRNYKIELPDLASDASPLHFGDWLHLCGPVMSDVSGVASRWWNLTMTQARNFYEEWKAATPLGRVQLEPRLPDELQDGQYSRTEQRGVGMLLRAIPADLQQTLVTDRQLTSTAILYRLHVRYQPGGPGEKTIILQQLTNLPKCSSVAELTTALRGWRRHYGRAREVEATLPDATLLLRALESAVQFISKEDAQASFRLAQSRVQLDIDARPSTATLWQFSQCLLAEAETLMLLQSSPATTASTPIKLKPMDANAGSPSPSPAPSNAMTGTGDQRNGKGKGGNPADTPCKWFCSDGGCRSGTKCRFSHSWDNVPDKQSRCWLCGSKEHRKQDCRLKGGKPKVDAGAAPGGGGGGSSKKDSKEATTSSTKASKPAVNEMTSSTATKGAAASQEGSTSGTGGTDSKNDMTKNAEDSAKGGAATEKLLQEATQLLKAMRGPILQPKLNAMQLSSLDHPDRDGQWILLDSGATHALRPARSQDEWDAGQPTTVMLAQGSTDRFRLKVGTQVLLQDPQATDVAAWIIPMGGLADIGCSVEWKGPQCRLHDPHGKMLPVEIRNGCPMVSQMDGRHLLQLLEDRQLRLLKRMLLIKTLTMDPGAFTGEMDIELALSLKVHQMFPELSAEVSDRLVPDGLTLQSPDLGSKVPWNRRKRRQLARAERIVVHLFSGEDAKFWEKRLSSSSTAVLCVDLLGNTKANLLDNGVFSFLLRIAASGRLKAIFGGPPCRTVSALRYQQDGGPGVVRSEEFPYGLPNQDPSDRELVVSDSVLFLRFLLLYMVAEEVRLPQEPPTAFLCEQPQDPATYRSAADVAQHEYFAMWRAAEWAAFASRYNIWSVSFDQGVMGHTIRKPTTVGTNMEPFLELNEMRCGPNWTSSTATSTAGQRQQLSIDDRCRQSRTWSAWAPGLKEAIVHCVQQHLQQGDVKPSPQQADGLDMDVHTQGVRQPRLQPLGPVALEQWRRRFQNDHFPARRDCAQCLRSQGRGRPHKRIRHADAYTLAVDLSGRLTPGTDQRGKTAKYLLIGAYTFPVTGSGKPLLQPPGVAEEQDHPLPPPGAGVDTDEADPAEPGHGQDLPDPVPADVHGQDLPDPVPVEANGQDLHDPVPAEAAVQIFDDPTIADEGLEVSGDAGPVLDAEEGAAPAVEVEGENAAVAAALSADQTWHRLVEEASDVSCRALTFVEVLESRHTRHVLPALARIHCRLRSLGLPLLRLHSDRARELIAAPIRRWTLDRGIIATLTSGDSYKSNGRAENEVNLTKKAIRAVLEPGEFSVQDWPLIARHIGERRLRHQLGQLGWPTGPLLRFGTKAYAVRKSWKHRYQDWRQVRESIVVLGPDPNSSLSSPSYYVKSLEDGKFFYTDDVVVPETELPAAQPAEPPLYLVERGSEPLPLEWQNEPRRRLRGKQAAPVLSMLHIEGETQLMKCFPMAFEPTDVIPAAVPQPGHRPPFLQLVDATDCYDDPDSGHSDSWTLGTSSSEMTTSEEEKSGGGDVEGVPNNRCGGSCPVTPRWKSPGPSSAVTWSPDDTDRQRALRTMHFNLGLHILEEMECLDATTDDQALWFPMLNAAIAQKAQLENTLQGMQEEAVHQQQQQLEAEFLVTKTINQQEVWNDLEAWTPSIRKEFDQLVNVKQAVRQITRQELQAMAAENDLPIELLPGKMVHTRKAVTGDYRSRAVVCGNFSEATTAECYAGGADGTQIRAAIKCSALHNWHMAATDIRVAFLNAPRRDHSKIVAMEVPKVFHKIGLATPNHVWVIDKALYGLTTSPRDWSLHRNEELPKIKWHVQRDGQDWTGGFKKTDDENLWRFEETCDATGEIKWTGILSVYVDDLLVGGEKPSIEAALEAVAKMWSVAEVEWATVDHPLKFCGFEISADASGDGFQVSQQRYEREMLQRWEVTEGIDYPVFKVSEEDEIPRDHIDPGQLRQAQAVAGSLLWLTTRTRPDILYGVATMSRLMSKNPEKALQIGQVLLKYIHKVPGGLHFSGRADGWGARNQLKVQRNEKLIEIFSDISYAAGSGHRSIEGVIGFFAGSPLVWQCHQQPFATHSTAESELVSYCESLIAGRSLEALLCTMWAEPVTGSQNLQGNPFKRVIYGDNNAAISLAHGTANSSWRTRHLRIRASVLKEALDPQSDYPAGHWLLLHLKGTELVADGLTKPLLGQAFDRFLQDLGMIRPLKNHPAGDHESGAGGKVTAMMALILGSSMMTQAKAMEADDEPNDNFDAVWIGGICLMLLGTIYLGQMVHSLSACCLRRLCAASDGSSVKAEKSCQAEAPLTSSLRRRPTAAAADLGPVQASRAAAADLGPVQASRAAAADLGPVQALRAAAADLGPEQARRAAAVPGPVQTSSGGSSSSIVVDAVAEALQANLDYDPLEELPGPVQATSVAAAADLEQAISAATLDFGRQRAAASSSGPEQALAADEQSEVRTRENLEVQIKNPWNWFQHRMRNQGLTSKQLAVLYKDFKRSNDL